MKTLYDKQWEILRKAKQNGWKGDCPSRLGTQWADQVVKEAAQYLEDIEHEKALDSVAKSEDRDRG